MATPTCADIIFLGFADMCPPSQHSKYGGVVKTLRRSNSLSRSIFSTAGSFGYFSGYLSFSGFGGVLGGHARIMRHLRFWAAWPQSFQSAALGGWSGWGREEGEHLPLGTSLLHIIYSEKTQRCPTYRWATSIRHFVGLSPSTVGSPGWFQEWLRIKGPSVFPIALPTVLGDALRLSPSTVGSPDWFSGMAPNQGPSVFPIALPTVLGDTLTLVAVKRGACKRVLQGAAQRGRNFTSFF